MKKTIKIKDKDVILGNIKYIKRGKYTQSINFIRKNSTDNLNFFDEMTPAEFEKYFTTFKLRLENLGAGHLLKR